MRGANSESENLHFWPVETDVHFGGPFCVRLDVANHDELSTLEMISVEIFLEILPGCLVTLEAKTKTLQFGRFRSGELRTQRDRQQFELPCER